jgi:TPR repeat protein
MRLHSVFRARLIGVALVLCLASGGAHSQESGEALRRSAESGSAEAQYRLGLAYTTGSGVPVDPVRAASWLTRAAEQGLPQAQHALAVAYELGLGLPGDSSHAVLWHRRAAEQGHQASQLRLGLLLSDESMDLVDYAEAVRWLSPAVDRGEPAAVWRLGSLLARGLGAEQDCKRAFLLLQQAAQGGDSHARYDFGLLFEKGCGVPRDLDRARYWYGLAADQGHLEARRRLERTDAERLSRAIHLRRARFVDASDSTSIRVRNPDEIRRGPDAPVRITPDDDVHCDYHPRDNQGGNPKFRCFMMTALPDRGGRYYDEDGVVRPQATAVMLTDTGNRPRQVLARRNDDGELEPLLRREGFKQRLVRPLELKVKYRSLDKPEPQGERDMYSEVAAARLMWTLGFPADRMYRPRRVLCHRCPRDPFSRRTPLEDGSHTIFDETSIELRYMGAAAETYEDWLDGGWSWGEELQTLRYGSGERAFDEEQKLQLDGLIVLMNILEHVSSLPAQNRFVCLRRGMQQVGVVAKYCPETVLLVHDLGSVFGKKAAHSLDAWSAGRVWADPARCEPTLAFKVPADDSIRPYLIGEPGRRFIAALLGELSDEHLRAVFESALFERFDITLVPPGEIPSPTEARAIVDAWIAAFREKIDQVSGVTCGAS